MMNIGQVSKATGVTAKMIRYYESIGVLPEADRRESGYRNYGHEDVHRLAFVRRARDLGFSMEQISDLLALWSDRSRSSAEVRAIALRHVDELQAQAAKLQAMVETLQHLISSCKQGDRPHCPIITELAGGLEQGPASSGRPRKPRRRL